MSKMKNKDEYPCRKLPTELRPQIKKAIIHTVVGKTRNRLFARLEEEKGFGSWLSRHEILGMLTEEYNETVNAVHKGTIEDVYKELEDVAVGCIFAMACIKSGTLDW